MKKIILILLTTTLTTPAIRADEGMWLVNLLDQNLQVQMANYGFKLDAKEVYNEQNPALHNAVVSLNFSCTGSMISEEGLMITNHHCAYDDIHGCSSAENNYLERGFWAKNRSEELPIAGKSVSFLRRVIDVTDEVAAYLDSCANSGKPVTPMGMRRVSSLFEDRYASGTTCEAALKSMFRGVKWYVFLYQTFTDVRLVGAPPVSIGAFGGEADNFRWTQHKGDFALYRIYTDKNGNPAEYAKDNIPLKPLKTLSISTKGIRENDFTMTLGYPFTTYRYIPSYGVNEKLEALNPAQNEVKRAILDAIKPRMAADTLIRLKYASKYFNMANTWELKRGEWVNLVRFNVLNAKRAEEAEMQAWIEADDARKAKYGGLLRDLERAYSSTLELNKAKTYFQETIIRASTTLRLSNRYKTAQSAAIRKSENAVLHPDSADVKQLISNTIAMYKDYDEQVERDILAVALRYYLQHVPERYRNAESTPIFTMFDGDARLIADYVFDHSIFRNESTFRAAFAKPVPAAQYMTDPVILLNKSASVLPFNAVEDSVLGGLDLVALRNAYADALFHYRKSQNKPQSPDANATMRLSYGRVGGFKPADGTYLAAQSTHYGYFDKADPTNYEFALNPRLKSLLEQKNFGRWGENDTLYINFLTDNDITGGSSGSPVLNAHGHLTGLAFDGNWESLAGDAHYENGYNKSVCVDIRYVLWIIEKYAEAGYLLEEMRFAE